MCAMFFFVHFVTGIVQKSKHRLSIVNKISLQYKFVLLSLLSFFFFFVRRRIYLDICLFFFFFLSKLIIQIARDL